jgi:large subunit ribosomal protein L25
MTTEDIAVALEERTTVTKGLRKLRLEGKVPAVVHNHGGESMHVMGDYVALVKAYQKAGKHHAVSLTLGGKKHLAIIRDVHFEPTKHLLQHVVFQAIKQNENISAEIPLVLSGDDIPAERASLIVLKHLDTIEVEAFPKDLPDQLTVDATSLAAVGDRLTVADIVVPKGVTILTDAEHVIATVEMPKDQIAEANASAADLAADAGESDQPEQEVGIVGDEDKPAEK